MLVKCVEFVIVSNSPLPVSETINNSKDFSFENSIRSHANQLKLWFYDQQSTQDHLPLDILDEVPTSNGPVLQDQTAPVPLPNEEENIIVRAPVSRRHRRYFGEPGVTTRSQRRLQLAA
ncbi:hypothetical protein ACFFRR_005266 [Megaselia abdita]